MSNASTKTVCKAGLRPRWAALGLTLLALSLSTGCASLQVANPAGVVAEQAATSGPMYQLEMKSSLGRTTVERAPIEGAMTIQDALEKSGALKKYRSMDITLSRIVNDSNQLLRLPVGFDASEDHVLPEQNYALHPGDTISIAPGSASSIENMIDSMTGGAL